MQACQFNGGDRKSNTQNGYLKTTAEVLGEQYGVAKNTIIRDAEFSAAVDKVATESYNFDKTPVIMRYFELYPTFMGIKGLGVKGVSKRKRRLGNLLFLNY